MRASNKKGLRISTARAVPRNQLKKFRGRNPGFRPLLIFADGKSETGPERPKTHLSKSETWSTRRADVIVVTGLPGTLEGLLPWTLVATSLR